MFGSARRLKGGHNPAKHELVMRPWGHQIRPPRR
eukprot:CAMPEP_0115748468 /NCGR_PEP_ID=MMETSP0272-20121206/93686_1 /TAXON_ID=71861 /ORGANISM="Scrippsiella trochoidea, Strain CCMP3099" /LENGTH=33 /DNA_ID= /DNA_START= /DNA_END= /DNA_ORIENTATION=